MRPIIHPFVATLVLALVVIAATAAIGRYGNTRVEIWSWKQDGSIGVKEARR